MLAGSMVRAARREDAEGLAAEFVTSGRFAPHAVALAAALAYVNAPTRAFVFDDDIFIAKDLHLDLDTVVRAFGEHATAHASVAVPVYRPLTMLTIALDGSLYGPSATGYHLTNVVLHILASLAVLGLARTLASARPAPAVPPSFPAFLPPLLGALVFAVHPIHTEAVDSIFNRSELLVTALGCVALRVLASSRAPRATAVACGLYFAALLCKESAVTLPALSAFVTVCFVGSGSLRDRLRPLWRLAALAMPLALYLALRHSALSHLGGSVSRVQVDDPTLGAGPLSRVLLVASTSGEHLRMVLWPHPLRASYAE